MEDLLTQQIEYYRARAGEYDEWFLRQGRYDRGPEANRDWFADVSQVQQALDDFTPTGNVLELAGGTGLWTRRLAPHAARLTVRATPHYFLYGSGTPNGVPDLREWRRDRATGSSHTWPDQD